MRTRTIFEAYADLEFENGQTWEAFAADMKPRKARQLKTFRNELLRRMDERDAMVAREHAPPDIRITAINGWRQNTVMPAKISLKGANE